MKRIVYWNKSALLRNFVKNEMTNNIFWVGLQSFIYFFYNLRINFNQFQIIWTLYKHFIRYTPSLINNGFTRGISIAKYVRLSRADRQQIRKQANLCVKRMSVCMHIKTTFIVADNIQVHFISHLQLHNQHRIKKISDEYLY